MFTRRRRLKEAVICCAMMAEMERCFKKSDKTRFACLQ